MNSKKLHFVFAVVLLGVVLVLLIQSVKEYVKMVTRSEIQIISEVQE